MRSISIQAGLQLLNVFVIFTLSTKTQTTGECEERSVTDTVALRLLYWDQQCEPVHSLASLQRRSEHCSNTKSNSSRSSSSTSRMTGRWAQFQQNSGLQLTLYTPLNYAQKLLSLPPYYYVFIFLLPSKSFPNRSPHRRSTILLAAWTASFTATLCKVKSSIARSLPVENLLPQNVGSIINYLQ